MAEVRFLGCDNDVFCSNVAAYAAEFQQASGHQVTVQLLGNDHYYTNKLTEYLGGDQPADVYMSGPVLAWEQLGLGFVRPLDEFTGRASASYDIAYFENPQLSSIAGQVRYALPPAGPSGLRRPNMWMWSMVMNARSGVPDAAWELMEWASSREFLARAALQGNMNPTRRSTWADPEFADRASQWHGFSGIAMELVNDLADVLVTPAVNYIDVARRWTRALRDAYRGAGSLEQCLGTAASDIDRMVFRA